PAGNLIKALIQPGQRFGFNRELDAAVDLIRAFGGEVLLPGQRTPTAAGVSHGIEAARQYLEALGYQIVTPEEQERIEGKQAPTREKIQGEFEAKEKARGKDERKWLKTPWSRRKLPENHPLYTGEMVRCGGENVYSIGYDMDNAYLYVRFWAKSHGKKSGPGAMYRYFDVRPEKFLAFMQARDSAGTWLWDHIRIRGTVSGHYHDYALVGISGGYVPRKATAGPGGSEWYVQREIRTTGNRWIKSQLQTQPAAWHGIEPFHGMPPRGARG
ncbi:MAG: KTSC domain-containing protein, partial [Planctomycetota bacterium]